MSHFGGEIKRGKPEMGGRYKRREKGRLSFLTPQGQTQDVVSRINIGSHRPAPACLMRGADS